MKIALYLLTGAVLFIAAVTYVALESSDVVVVTTQTADPIEIRETHIWFVENDNGIFLEAGNPDNPWVRELATTPTLILSGSSLDGEYRFQRHPANSHIEIRALMRAKYGWRDRWIALLFDTSRSFMIELEPIEQQEMQP